MATLPWPLASPVPSTILPDLRPQLVAVPVPVVQPGPDQCLPDALNGIAVLAGLLAAGGCRQAGNQDHHTHECPSEPAERA
jgi:hypothetical protein